MGRIDADPPPPSPVSSCREPRCSGKPFGLVTFAATSAEPPGYSAPVGVPGLIVTALEGSTPARPTPPPLEPNNAAAPAARASTVAIGTSATNGRPRRLRAARAGRAGDPSSPCSRTRDAGRRACRAWIVSQSGSGAPRRFPLGISETLRRPAPGRPSTRRRSSSLSSANEPPRPSSGRKAAGVRRPSRPRSRRCRSRNGVSSARSPS